MRLVEVVSSGPVVLVDAGVARDMASALTGVWSPETGRNRARSAELVAAARLRLYGDRDRSGWYLMTTRPAAAVALRRGDADWSVGMLPVAEDFEDAPAPAEVAALAEMYRREQSVPGEAAYSLALAMLYPPVQLLVARLPREFRHQREGDLPARLEVLEPAEAVERLDIAPGEQPMVALPIGSMLDRGDPFWLVG
jgi:hypothetical protein